MPLYVTINPQIGKTPPAIVATIAAILADLFLPKPQTNANITSEIILQANLTSIERLK